MRRNRPPPLPHSPSSDGPVPLPYGVLPEGDWAGRVCLLVGTGPSRARHDVARIKALRDEYGLVVVAVKESAWDLPWADLCVSVDIKWHRRRDLSALTMPLVCVAEEPWFGPLPPALWIRPQERGWLSTDPARVVLGCTSGFAALNVATIRGARRICLLGYDYAHGRDGAHHASPEHNPWYPLANERLWTWWRAPFQGAKPTLKAIGATVVNASGGMLDEFPRMELEDALSHLHRMGPP